MKEEGKKSDHRLNSIWWTSERKSEIPIKDMRQPFYVYLLGYLLRKMMEENWAKIKENWAYLIIPCPPRKRRSSPLPTSSTKSKPSFTALASRSGSLGKGGQDRDLRESHPRSRSASWKRSSLSPQRSRGGVNKKAKVLNKKAPISGSNAVSIDSSDVHHPRSRGGSSSSRRPVSPIGRGLRRDRSRSNER